MPAAPRGIFAHQGLTFEVADSGPDFGRPGAETVVMLHGFPQRASSWDAVSTYLQRAGYRTVAPDQRGYSPGARPSGRSAYTLDLLVGDITALIEQIGGPVHLVGHDWGGAVAWALAATRPDLLRTLTVVSTPHPRALRAAMPHGQRQASTYMQFFQLPWLPERTLTRLAHRSAKQALMGDRSPGAWARFRDEVVDDGALTGGLMWYRALPLRVPPELYGRVTVPTLYAWSSGDRFLLRYGAEHTGDYVDGDYEFVELSGGHFIPEDQPEALATAILGRIRATA